MPRRRRNVQKTAANTDEDDGINNDGNEVMKDRQRALQLLARSLQQQGRVYRKQHFKLTTITNATTDPDTTPASDSRLEAAQRTAATALRIRERIEKR